MPEYRDVPMPFCYKRNKQKALAGLYGILLGITADQRLRDVEVLFLDAWLKSDAEFKKQGDFLDIQCAIADVLEDGVMTADERDDLLSLLEDVLKYNAPKDDDMERLGELTNLLLGFLQGISADDSIAAAEVEMLNNLLQSSEELLSAWPGNLLYQRLQAILADGVITEAERNDLLELIKQISGQRFTDTGLAVGMATEFFADEGVMSLQGKAVCFTGKFFSNTRFNLEQQAKLLGAEPLKAMSKKVNVLIIGSLANRDWMFTSHGRKIEAAIKNREEGHDIRIINEEDWVRIASEPLAV